jgi:hypothetical protein
MRKRVSTKSPVRENCTPGSVRGLSGNRQSYRDLKECETVMREWAINMSLERQESWVSLIG